VVLTLRDPEGAQHFVTVTPQPMDPVPLFAAQWSSADTLVLSVQAFDPGLGRWLGRQLQGLSPDVDVVLDLRGNPGGRLLEADAVLACFLPRDQTWATRTGRNGRAVTMRVSQRCGDLRAPATNDLAVLVDGASRSAAELTPAALQEAGRAVVVGERTGGAVLIAQDTDLPDGGRLTLSRADFITRGGVRLEKTGVTPDVVAERTLEDRRAGRDPVLTAAVAALEGRRDMVSAAGAVEANP
jgi:carboxyl-terminal processing protease